MEGQIEGSGRRPQNLPQSVQLTAGLSNVHRRDYAQSGLFALIGLLHAIPKTPLYDRLLKEDRLDLADVHQFGTNVIPKQMTRQELRDGYLATMREAYEPAVYFDRLDQLFLRDGFKFRTFETPYFRSRPLLRARHTAFFFVGFLFVFWKLMRGTPDANLRRIYRGRIFNAMRQRFTSPVIYFFYAIKCAMHFHHHKMTTDMIEQPEKFVSSYGKAMRTEKEPCSTPHLVPITVKLPSFELQEVGEP